MHLAAARDLPEPRRLVVAGRGDEASVWAEADAVHAPGVARKSAHQVAAGDLPDAYGVVAAGRGGEEPVGAERGAVDAGGVSQKLAPELPAHRVPNPRRSILARRDQDLAIGGELYVGERLLVAGQHAVLGIDGAQRIGEQHAERRMA